jgi:hypothetical protein
VLLPWVLSFACSVPWSLAGDPAAVDHHRVAGYERGCVGEQPDDAFANLRGLAPAAHRLKRPHVILVHLAAIYDPRGHLSLDGAGVTSLSFLALAIWLSGYPDRALAASDEAIALGRHLAHPLSLAVALTYRALLHLCRREAASALEMAEEAHSLTLQLGFQYWSALASAYRGIAIAAMARPDEVISAILEGIGSYRATGSELGAALIMVGLASSYLNADRTEEVLTTVAQGLANTERTGARLSNAELYRLKGEALLRSKSDFEREAHSCFETAIATALSQGARAWQSRATTSLARLLTMQGHRGEAEDTRAYLWRIH